MLFHDLHDFNNFANDFHKHYYILCVKLMEFKETENDTYAIDKSLLWKGDTIRMWH